MNKSVKHACREDMVHEVAKWLLHEHEEMGKFTAGFNKPKTCKCEGCKMARKLIEGKP